MCMLRQKKAAVFRLCSVFNALAKAAKIKIHLFTLRMLAAQGIDAAVEFT